MTTEFPVRIVIEGIDSPGRTCTGPDGIGLGIQHGKEVVQVVGSSTESPRFEADLTLVRTDDGPDFRGPYVHGPRGGRFLYLAWVSMPKQETVARIKLLLNDVHPALLDVVGTGDGSLRARVSLTNASGKPASGSVRPPLVAWSVGESGQVSLGA